jgi:hypothetical protein
MLTKTLLITTALVLCVSTAIAVPNAEKARARISQRLMKFGTPVIVRHGFPVTVVRTGRPGHLPKPHAPYHFARGVTYDTLDEDDKNAQFVSWYGYRVEKASSCFTSSTYHSCFTASATNAIPITGLGYRAGKVSVPLSSFTPSAEYNVGLYSATASGLPGNELTGASTTASDTTYCCTGLRTVKVDPIKLKAGEKYFVEVTGGKNSTNSDGAWDMESLDWSGDQVDCYQFKEHVTYNSGSGTYSSNFSSPWHCSNTIANPAAKVY